MLCLWSHPALINVHGKTVGWLLSSGFFNPIVFSWGFESVGMISAALWYGEGRALPEWSVQNGSQKGISLAGLNGVVLSAVVKLFCNTQITYWNCCQVLLQAYDCGNSCSSNKNNWIWKIMIYNIYLFFNFSLDNKTEQVSIALFA